METLSFAKIDLQQVEKNNINSERVGFTHSVSMLLFRSLSLKNLYTGSHSDRTAQMTMNFVALYQYGFQGNRMDLIRIAALIHDIGKIGINNNILNKPSKLSEDEYKVIKNHPQYGYRLIKPLLSTPIIRDVILCHHENYDGSGYPIGLRGTDIPLAARLVRIIDYYDALTSVRPYRAALSSGKAIKMMESNNQLFDPDLFSFFVNNLESVVTRKNNV